MPIPLIVWAGVGLAGGLGLGGYKFGEEAGENIGDALPLLAGSVLVYALLKSGAKS